MHPSHRSWLLLLFLLQLALSPMTATGQPPGDSPDSKPVPASGESTPRSSWLPPTSNAPPQGEVHDLRFPEPTSTRNVYRAWERAFGIQVIFDPSLRDSEIKIDLVAVTAQQALTLITQATGHFHVELEHNAFLIAEDTPQNRRQYETQVLRTFYLENLEVKDAMTMVRSILGLKHVAAHEALRIMVVRDVGQKVDVIAELLRTIDRPQGEIVVEVTILHLGAKSRGKLVAKLGSGDGLPERVSAAQLESIRQAGRRVAGPRLSVLDGDQGSLRLRDELTATADDNNITYLELGLEVEIKPRLHAGSDEVTLEVEAIFSDLAGGETLSEKRIGPIVGTRKINSTARLKAGQSLLLSGILESVETRDGSLLASLLERSGGGQGELVLALTPRIVRRPGFSADDLEAISIGTETAIQLRGTSRTEAAETNHPGPG